MLKQASNAQVMLPFTRLQSPLFQVLAIYRNILGFRIGPKEQTALTVMSVEALCSLLVIAVNA